MDQDAAVKTLRENLASIKQALEAGEFALHYQPKVNMKTGDVIGAEALIRWQHPTRGLLTPENFLPFTEGHPVCVELGDWVIATALDQLAQWQAQGLNLPVSVNIAAHHLVQSDFVPRLERHLAKHPEVSPHYLELEVLESSALEDMPLVTEIMQDCLRLGVKFALDDFGTGYSSLTYLKRLPAELLKIDQSFVRAMLDDPEDLAIVHGVMGLASAFRRDVLAEGVETEAHGELLLLIGCDKGQGYGIARPMPAHEMPGWVAHWQPYPSWVAWQSRDFQRDDLPMLFADVELRAWIRSAEQCLANGTKPPPFPGEDQCQLGRWYTGLGRIRYGDESTFHSIEPLHLRIHALMDELHETARDDRESRDRLKELDELREQLAIKLKALSHGVSGHGHSVR